MDLRKKSAIRPRDIDIDNRINEYNFFSYLVATEVQYLTTTLEKYNRAVQKQYHTDKALSTTSVRSKAEYIFPKPTTKFSP